jgi:Tfp pilus assembly protein PilO
MTGRDRMVLIGVVVLAVLAGAWLLVVSPERQQAGKLDAQVSEARAQLVSAEGLLSNARSAQTQYAAAYASLVSLGKAVPTSDEVPSLIYQLAQASHQKRVEFSSITSGSTSGAGSSTPSSAAATPTAAAAGFSQMPFTFVFNGNYFDLEHLFQQLNRFTLRTTSGGLQVSGRLLTIQSVKLAPLASSGLGTGQSASGQLSGSITATAYVLPAGQGLTGASTATSPTGATTPASSTTGASSSPTAPAIARVTP